MVTDSKWKMNPQQNFQIISNLSICGNSVLMDSLGFSYNFYFKNKNSSIRWICSKKSSKTKWVQQLQLITKKKFTHGYYSVNRKKLFIYFRCASYVVQVGNVFLFGEKPHLCQPNPNMIHILLFQQRINLEVAVQRNEQSYKECTENDCEGEAAST